MTYDAAVRIIRTSSYRQVGRALIALDWISQATYDADYDTTTRTADRLVANNATETIKLARTIQGNYHPVVAACTHPNYDDMLFDACPDCGASGLLNLYGDN